MKVLVTGAAGIVGSTIREHLADSDEYEFTYLDETPLDADGAVTADVTDYEAIRPAFDGQDAVVDLAVPPGLPTDDRSVGWSNVYRANLRATTTVLEAAVDAGVDTVVYGSSNHVVGMYELEHGPRIYEPGHGVRLDHTVPVRPDSMYGVVKAHDEALARLCADAHDLSAYCLRIGSVREPEADHPYSDAERGGRPDTADADLDRDSEEYRRRVGRMKALWQSRRDCAHLVDCCLRDDTVDFDVFYGVSDNERRWFDIEHAREVLGYDPQDDAEEWTEPP
jgi:nucleoside-diphosphate-sugar epimerase